MQRAGDREVDKDDRGGGRPGLLTSAPAITTTTTATRRPLPKRKRDDNADNDDKDDSGDDDDNDEYDDDGNDDIVRREDDEGERKKGKIMPPYKSKVKVLDEYHIIGFISSGTYGRVYKARSKIPGNTKEFAIKKWVVVFVIKLEVSPFGLVAYILHHRFKPDKEGEVIQYTGISQSACREMAVSSPPPTVSSGTYPD